jgi:cytochrome b561
MTDDREAAQYDHKTIALHWLTALLVILLWCVGQTIDWFPRGAPRVYARSVHIVTGDMLAIILLVRIHWRITGGARLPSVAAGAAGRLEKIAHGVLYLALFATIALGIANSLIRGDQIFGLFRIPSIAPGNKELREFVEDLHGDAANILLVLAAVHAAVALFHHFRLRNRLLYRMSFRNPPPQRSG